MTTRFLQGWASVGSITIGPTSGQTVVGSVTLSAGADTLWVRVQQLGGESPWPYGYGLLFFKTTDGRELGTVKAWGHTEGEVLRLSVGLAPGVSEGQLIFEPRSYNLGWVKAGAPPWSLSFSQRSGTTNGGGAAISGSFAAPEGYGLELLRVVYP